MQKLSVDFVPKLSTRSFAHGPDGCPKAPPPSHRLFLHMPLLGIIPQWIPSCVYSCDAIYI